jgi:hypothetical protein
MSADLEGNGLMLVGPKGTKKTELFFALLQDDKFRLHSNDIVFVRFSEGKPLADSVERKLFLPTNTVESYPRLAALFDNSKCENVIIRKEDCQDSECLRLDDCRLERGSPFCYKASKDAHALLDPFWIGGPAKHVKRTALRWLVILRYDNVSPAVEKIKAEDALRIFESGETPGVKQTLSPSKSQPFYNPHLLLKTPERLELQRNFFKRLLESSACYLFNSGKGSVDDLKKMLER